MTKLQKFVNWKFKKFLTTQIFTSWTFYYISTSIKMFHTSKVMKSILINIFYQPFYARWWQKIMQTQINLQLSAVDDLLLPRSIKGLNSHNNLSMISTLNHRFYWLLNCHSKNLSVNSVWRNMLVWYNISAGMLLWDKSGEKRFIFFPRQFSSISY